MEAQDLIDAFKEPRHWEPGELIEWRYSPRGGYGYQWWIPGVVIKDTGKRVQIQVTKANGGVVLRSVNRESLRKRPTPAAGG